MKKMITLMIVSMISLGAFAAVTLEQIASADKGAECNAMLIEYYSEARTTSAHVQKFDPAPATWDECISYYKLILKNVERNENTEADLVFIKNQLMKLTW